MTGDSSGGTKILILSVSHGAAHRRAGEALRSAFLALQPGLRVEVVDGLAHCAPWFRAYYNSYTLPLKYWPSLWGWIENIQHESAGTGPTWLYRWGAQPLFRYLKAVDPDIVIATEVGMCELAAMYKREAPANFYLVGLELMDFNQAWVQAEVDLYPVAAKDLGAELVAAGAPYSKIFPCGFPIDPAFGKILDRTKVRKRLEIRPEVPLLLILFGGEGYGKPRRILQELKKVQYPWQAVFITGNNRRLENQVRELCQGIPHSRVLGWVDNIHEWMGAADLLLGKPGGATLFEACSAGVPFLAFDPLPGNELRTCGWIEKWGVGNWVRQVQDLAPTIEHLLSHPHELRQLRQRARALAKPRAAYDAAEAVLKFAVPERETPDLVPTARISPVRQDRVPREAP